MDPITMSMVFTKIKSYLTLTNILIFSVLIMGVTIYVQHGTNTSLKYKLSVKEQKIFDISTDLKTANANVQQTVLINDKMALIIKKQNDFISKAQVDQAEIARQHKIKMGLLDAKYKKEINDILGHKPPPVDFECERDRVKAIDAIQAINNLLGDEK